MFDLRSNPNNLYDLISFDNIRYSAVFEDIKTKDELQNSSLLDVYTASYWPEARDLIDKIYLTYIRPKQNQHNYIQKKHLGKIILHLYVTWFYDPDTCTAINFDNNAYKPDARYNKIKITKSTIEVAKLLIDEGLLGVKGGWQDPKGRGFLTRVWPKDELIKYFEEAKINILDVTFDINRETIILQDIDKTIPKSFTKSGKEKKQPQRPIPYNDNPNTKRMRTILACYNELLRYAHIDVATAEKDYILSVNDYGKERKVFIRPHVTVRRVFNSGSWTKGGRYYGAWWMNCSRIDRQDIFINGNRTVEVDFKATHPMFLYAQEGVNYWEITKGRDPYIIPVPELADYPNFNRYLIKQLMLTALNEDDKQVAFSATRQSVTKENMRHDGTKRPPKDVIEKLDDNFLDKVFDEIRNAHHPIEHFFFTGLASDLQFMDSEITAQIIEHFTEHYIPVLTIHDSYVIEEEFASVLVDVMMASFREVTRILEARMYEGEKKPKPVLERIGNRHTLHNIKVRNELEELSSKAGRTGLKVISKFPMLEYREGFNKETQANLANVKYSSYLGKEQKITQRYFDSYARHTEWIDQGRYKVNLEDEDTLNQLKEFRETIDSKVFNDWLIGHPFYRKDNDPSG